MNVKEEKSIDVANLADNELLEDGTLVSMENETMVSSVFDIRANRSMATNLGDLQLDETLNYFIERDLSKRGGIDEVSICISTYSDSLNGSFDEECLAVIKTNVMKDHKLSKSSGDSHDHSSTTGSQSRSSCSEGSISEVDQSGCIGRYKRSSRCFKFSLMVTFLLLVIFFGMAAYLFLFSNEPRETMRDVDTTDLGSTQLPVPTHPPANEKDQDQITNEVTDESNVESTQESKSRCTDDYTKLFKVDGVARDCGWLADIDSTSRASLCNPFLSPYSICLKTCGSCDKAVVP
jgi:hypothetical protein